MPARTGRATGRSTRLPIPERTQASTWSVSARTRMARANSRGCLGSTRAKAIPRSASAAIGERCHRRAIASADGPENDGRVGLHRPQPCGDRAGAVLDPDAPGVGKDLHVADGAGEVAADDAAWHGGPVHVVRDRQAQAAARVESSGTSPRIRIVRRIVIAGRRPLAPCRGALDRRACASRRRRPAPGGSKRRPKPWGRAAPGAQNRVGTASRTRDSHG